MKNMLFNRNSMLINRRWNSRFDSMLEAKPEDFVVAANEKMYGLVKNWWDQLSPNLQAAIRAFKFSRTLITGQMFFADTVEAQDVSGFTLDYVEFAQAILTYYMQIAHDETMEEKARNTYGTLWSNVREIMAFEQLYNRKLKEAEEYASRIRKASLREEVVHDLLRSDEILIEKDQYFTDRINDGRKCMLEHAIERLARENGI